MNCRVLIVDDDEDDVNEAIAALSVERQNGIATDSALTLKDAIKKLESQSFDALILDLGLPESKGLETLQRVRAITKNTPIVIRSDLNDEGSARQALEYGAQDYCIKGMVTGDALIRSIRHAIHRQQACSENMRLVQELRSNELQLQKKQQMLEEKNHRLEELCHTAHKFVDNVSHEFRTPLTVIKEYSSLMLDGVVGPVGDEQRRMLNVIGDRTNDLGNMVDDMLDISKIKSGLIGLSRAACPLEEIIENVRPGLARKAEIKEVDLDFCTSGETLPELYCDPEKISRIITNLTVNAIKFCGKPGRVRVHCKLLSDEDVVIEVEDNGRGIDPEQLQQIFERFTQIDSNINSSTKGFGLGLSICKDLVQLNFGSLSVKSELGHGSCFSFTIPTNKPLCVLRRYLKWLQETEGEQNSVSLVEGNIPPSSKLDDADDITAFLSYLLCRHDIVFRVNNTSWLILLGMNDLELNDFFHRAENTFADANRNRFKGPFPSIEWRNLGTWNIDETDMIQSQVTQALDSMESVYV